MGNMSFKNILDVLRVGFQHVYTLYQSGSCDVVPVESDIKKKHLKYSFHVQPIIFCREIRITRLEVESRFTSSCWPW